MRNDDPELGKIRPERVCQHRLLPDRQRPCAMQHGDSLLAGAFDRHTYPPDGETRAWWGRLKRGYTYLSLQTGIEAFAVLGVSISMINTPTNYQSGAELHFQGALNEHFPFGLPAGVGGYKQLTPDGGSGDMVGAFRGRVAAIGSLLSYAFMEGTQGVILSGRWFNEFDVTHRVQETRFWPRSVSRFRTAPRKDCGAVAKSGSAQPRASLAGRCPGGLANTAFVA